MENKLNLATFEQAALDAEQHKKEKADNWFYEHHWGLTTLEYLTIRLSEALAAAVADGQRSTEVRFKRREAIMLETYFNSNHPEARRVIRNQLRVPLALAKSLHIFTWYHEKGFLRSAEYEVHVSW